MLRILALAIVVPAVVAALANVHHVDHDPPTAALNAASAAAAVFVALGGSDTEPCTDPLRPCATLVRAIEQAAPNATVWVAPAAQPYPCPAHGRGVLVNKPLTIIGAAGPSAEYDARRVVFDCQSHARAFFINGTGGWGGGGPPGTVTETPIAVRLSRVDVVHGAAWAGGAVLALDATLHMHNCTVAHSVAWGLDGRQEPEAGWASIARDPSVTAKLGGGAVLLAVLSPLAGVGLHLRDVHFRDVHAAGGYGGAVSMVLVARTERVRLELGGATFSDCSTAERAGGCASMVAQQPTRAFTASVEGSTFRDCAVRYKPAPTASAGGALFFWFSDHKPTVPMAATPPLLSDDLASSPVIAVRRGHFRNTAACRGAAVYVAWQGASSGSALSMSDTDILGASCPAALASRSHADQIGAVVAEYQGAAHDAAVLVEHTEVQEHDGWAFLALNQGVGIAARCRFTFTDLTVSSCHQDPSTLRQSDDQVWQASAGGVYTQFWQVEALDVEVTGGRFSHCNGSALQVSMLSALDSTISVAGSHFSHLNGSAGAGVNVVVLGETVELELAVRHSDFKNVSAALIGGGVSALLVHAVHSRVAVEDCSFAHAQATVGGGLLVATLADAEMHSASTTVTRGVEVVVTRSRFTDCHAQGAGGGVALFMSGLTNDSRNVVTNSTFEDCTAATMRGGGLVLLASGVLFSGIIDGTGVQSEPSTLATSTLRNASFHMSTTRFTNCQALGGGGGAALVLGELESIKVTVRDSNFVSCGGQGGQHASSTDAVGGGMGMTVSNSSRDVHIMVQGTTFRDCGTFGTVNEGGGLGMSFTGSAEQVHFSLQDSVVSDCAALRGGGVSLTFAGPVHNATQLVTDSNFASCRAYNGGGMLVVHSGSSDTFCELRASSFSSCSATVAGGGMAVWHLTQEGQRNSVNVSNCHFRGTTASQLGGAGLYVVLPDDELAMSAWWCKNDAPDAQFPGAAYRYTNVVKVQDSTFVDSASRCPSCVGGGVGVHNGLALITNCHFQNCDAPAGGGGVFTAGTAALDVLNTTMLADGPAGAAHDRPMASQLWHMGTGELLLGERVHINVSVYFDAQAAPTAAFAALDVQGAGRIALQPGSTVQCPQGYTMQAVDWNTTWPQRRSLVPRAAQLPFPLPGISVTVQMETLQLRMCAYVTQSKKLRCMRCPSGKYLMSEGMVVDGEISGTECSECPEQGANCTAGGADVRIRSDYWAEKATAAPRAAALLFNGTTAPAPLQLQDAPLAVVRCLPGYCCPESTGTCAWNDTCAPNRQGVLCSSCAANFTEALATTQCRPVERCGTSWQDICAWFAGALFLAVVVKYLTTQASAAVNGSALTKVQWSLHRPLIFFYQTAPLLRISWMSSTLAVVQWVESVFGMRPYEIFPKLIGAVSQKGSPGVCPWPGLTAVDKKFFVLAVPAALALALCITYAVSWLRLRRAAPLSRLPVARVQGLLVAELCAALMMLLLLSYTAVAGAVVALVRWVRIPHLGTRLYILASITCFPDYSSPRWWWVMATLLVAYILPLPLALWLASVQMGPGKPNSMTWTGGRLPLSRIQWACLAPLLYLAHCLVAATVRRCRRYLQKFQRIVQRSRGGDAPVALLLSGPSRGDMRQPLLTASLESMRLPQSGPSRGDMRQPLLTASLQRKRLASDRLAANEFAARTAGGVSAERRSTYVGAASPRGPTGIRLDGDRSGSKLWQLPAVPPEGAEAAARDVALELPGRAGVGSGRGAVAAGEAAARVAPLNEDGQPRSRSLAAAETISGRSTLAMLAVLRGPYKQDVNKDGSSGTAHWEAFIIFRRLAMLLVNVFFYDDEKLEAFIQLSLCVLWLVEDRRAAPYARQRANTLSVVSAFALVVLAMANLCRLSGDDAFILTAQQPSVGFSVFIGIVEVLAFVLPAAVFVFMVWPSVRRFALRGWRRCRRTRLRQAAEEQTESEVTVEGSSLAFTDATPLDYSCTSYTTRIAS